MQKGLSPLSLENKKNRINSIFNVYYYYARYRSPFYWKWWRRKAVLPWHDRSKRQWRKKKLPYWKHLRVFMKLFYQVGGVKVANMVSSYQLGCQGRTSGLEYYRACYNLYFLKPHTFWFILKFFRRKLNDCARVKDYIKKIKRNWRLRASKFFWLKIKKKYTKRRHFFYKHKTRNWKIPVYHKRWKVKIWFKYKTIKLGWWRNFKLRKFYGRPLLTRRRPQLQNLIILKVRQLFDTNIAKCYTPCSLFVIKYIYFLYYKQKTTQVFCPPQSL